MRTCLTLNDRPQECYNSELNTPWLFTLVAIFSGCICLTVTIVLMVISHWDRTVGPYAKWIGFSAGKKDKYLIFMNIGINFHFSHIHLKQKKHRFFSWARHNWNDSEWRLHLSRTQSEGTLFCHRHQRDLRQLWSICREK